jgi:phosphoribosylaminoimidazolecarboxamide formyltransferase / IMP cyclohydrolase
MSIAMRALISVWDKQHVVEFARGLASLNLDGPVEFVSTGNTRRLLDEAGLPVRSVSEVTGFPEILDGRVKTLHPSIHGGILARRDLPAHQQELATHQIGPFDLVVVNLYPFAQTIAQPGITLSDALEHIDIGGVALVRAAAKNFPAVLPVVDPSDYEAVLSALRSGDVPMEMRRRLATRAFAHTAAYDAAIATYLSDTPFPATLPVAWKLDRELRYGENPHQRAALYGDFSRYFEQLHGKELSLTNVLDVAAAQELIEEFHPDEGVALAIIKHTNPCGAAVAPTGLEAWQHALATDSVSAFGGIIATNAPCDLPLAQAIDQIFTEIVIAPAFEPAALELLQQKKNRRLMRSLQPVTERGSFLLHSVPGGVLVQEADRNPLEQEPLKVVTRRHPTEDETRALRFAWRIAKHVKSNAIVYTAADRTLGVGAGQMSRVDSARMAVWKAQDAGLSLQGSVVASDAMFPFADGVEQALQAGATAVIQPGGSVRDEEVIAAADRAGAAMVFTGHRHFWH